MGWWAENKEETAVWGDSPADVLDDAIAEVNKVFQRELGRDVTKFELRRGLEFSMGGPVLKETPDA